MSIKRIAGMTLIELMIALLINMILLAALLYVFAANVRNYSQVINADTLNLELQTAMNIMISDIRRAGYWVNAKNDINGILNTNPFMTALTDFTVVSSSCLLFTYDHALNGILPAISSASDDDRYGFRLSAGVLQTRPPGALYSCTAVASAWENMTNPNLITITALTFTLTSVTLPIGSSSHNVTIRSLNITLTGQLTSNTSITKTLTQHVRLRNDKYVLP